MLVPIVVFSHVLLVVSGTFQRYSQFAYAPIGLNVGHQQLPAPQAEGFLQPTNINQDFIPEQEEINLSDSRFNYFDLALLKEFSKLDENVVISPLSIKTTLAMVLEGARGVCADEIRQALRIGSIEEARRYLKLILSTLKQTQYLDSANAIFASHLVDIYPDFYNKIQEYKGALHRVDFSNVPKAVIEINSWVYEKTHGMIGSIITPDSINKDFTVMILNALHFKGKWRTSFDDKNTRLAPFETRSRGKVQVDMMQVSGYFNYQYLKELHAEAIDIPYEDEYSMLIILPGKDNNVENVATDMSKLDQILDNLNRTELNLNVPKFGIEYSKNLIDVLKPLSVTTIFSPKANLTGITPQGNVLVNNIVHKARIEVDEEGTKASAATGVLVIPLMGSTAKKVTVNRPFTYFIYHIKTRTIIFEGIFREPTVQRDGPQQKLRI